MDGSGGGEEAGGGAVEADAMLGPSSEAIGEDLHLDTILLTSSNRVIVPRHRISAPGIRMRAFLGSRRMRVVAARRF